MIKNDEQLCQAIDQLGRMYRALVALRGEVLPQNPQQFALMSEGPLDEIQHLQEQINAYTGFSVALENDADARRRKLSKDVFDGFTVNVFLDEDGDYLAHFVEMPNVSAFSDTPEGALKELALAWEGVKESYRKHNEPIPSGPLIPRGIE